MTWWKISNQLHLCKAYLISWPSSESFLYLALQCSSFCITYLKKKKREIQEMIHYLIWHVVAFLAFIGGKGVHTSAWTLAMAASMSFWLYFRTSMMDSSTFAGCENGGARLSRIGGWWTVTAWMNERYTNSFFFYVSRQSPWWQCIATYRH